MDYGNQPSAYYALAALVTDVLPRKRSRIEISRTTDHDLVAVVDVVSPENKSSAREVGAFVGKAVDALKIGIHVLLLDLFPPGSHDRQGIHAAIWSEMAHQKFEPPSGKQLAAVAYCASSPITACVEPLAVGNVLREMPLFLGPNTYVSVPLASTYQAAWEGVPAYWRQRLTSEPEA